MHGVQKRGKRWIARPYIQGTGRVYGGTWDSEEEATKAALRILDEEQRLSGRESVHSFAARWLRDYPRPKASTNDTYRNIVARFAREFGSRKLHRVMPREAREYALQHPSDIFALSAMFADARREGLALANPFRNLRIPRGRGRRDIVVVTEEELQALADLALTEHGEGFGSVVRAAIAFAGYTGVRPGELCGLDWGDVDLEAGEVRVCRQFHRGRETAPKTGEARTIFLSPVAIDALRSVLPQRVVCGVTGGDVVFAARGDRRMTTAALSGYWKPVREAFEAQLDPQRLRELREARGSEGRPALDFYDLRHLCATMLVERGVESWVIARQLGHRDGGRLVQTTYGHPRDEIARERLREVFERPQRPKAPPEPAAPIGHRARLAVVEGGAA